MIVMFRITEYYPFKDNNPNQCWFAKITISIFLGVVGSSDSYIFNLSVPCFKPTIALFLTQLTVFWVNYCLGLTRCYVVTMENPSKM